MIAVVVYEEDLAENISEFLTNSFEREVVLLDSLEEVQSISLDGIELIIYLNRYDLTGEKLTSSLKDLTKYSNIPVILLVNDIARADLIDTPHHLLKLPFELDDLKKLIDSLDTAPVVIHHKS